MRKIIATILAIVCLALPLQDIAQDASEAWKLLHRAEEAYAQGLYQDMQTCLNEGDILIGRLDEAARRQLLPYWNKSYGSYYFLRIGSDAQAAQKARQHYRQAWDMAAYDSYLRSQLTKEWAQLEYRMGNYAEALRWLGQHPRYGDAVWHSQVAMCYANMEEFNQADIHLSEAMKVMDNHASPDYYELIRRRAKIAALRNEVGDSLSSSAADYRTYFHAQKGYVDSTFATLTQSQREQYWMTEGQYLTDTYRLEDVDAPLLYDIALFCKGRLIHWMKDTTPRDVTWQEVQRGLSAKACAIEFVQYERQGAEHLGALLLRHEGQPRFVRLLPLDTLLEQQLRTGRTVRQAIESTIKSDKNALFMGDTLSHLIWTPLLMELIGDDKELYFAPEGILHQIPIEYLLPRGKRGHRLHSTRLLADRRPTGSPTFSPDGRALLCGGLDYMARDTSRLAGNDSAAYLSLRERNVALHNLPCSLQEVEAIRQLRGNACDTLLTGAQGSEAAFRHIAPGCPLLHLATHGNFSGRQAVPTDLTTARSDNTMSESCLMLSSAMYNLGDGTHPSGTQDGILSAREIASLDLSHTSLAFLSACQSAVGQVTADGVYGLQRGLKCAGVGAMVVTLWNVDDQAAAIFAAKFYESLSTQSLRQAFATAQEHLRNHTTTLRTGGRKTVFNAARVCNETRETPIVEKAFHPYQDPAYWAPFVLIDGD